MHFTNTSTLILPCKNCLCLPVCKQQYIDAFHDGGNHVRRLVHAKLSLKSKCSMIRDHFETYYGMDSMAYNEGLIILNKFFMENSNE